MPKGWTHATNEHGRRVRDRDLGFAPVAEPQVIPVLQALFAAHTSGATYQKLADLLVLFAESRHMVRRDHMDPDSTYAMASRIEVRPFFCVREIGRGTRRSRSRSPAICRGRIQKEIFDCETRCYLGRVELVRIGRYFRRLVDDIEGIAKEDIDGFKPVMRDDLDTKGVFYVGSKPWPWPKDESGQEVPSCGIRAVCRQVGARLLRELATAVGPLAAAIAPIGSVGHFRRSAPGRCSLASPDRGFPDARLSESGSRCLRRRDGRASAESGCRPVRSVLSGRHRGCHWVDAGSRIGTSSPGLKVSWVGVS